MDLSTHTNSTKRRDPNKPEGLNMNDQHFETSTVCFIPLHPPTQAPSQRLAYQSNRFIPSHFPFFCSLAQDYIPSILYNYSIKNKFRMRHFLIDFDVKSAWGVYHSETKWKRYRG